MEQPLAYLFELRGSHPGLSRALTGEPFRIGSGADNDLVTGDPGVKSRQVEIVLDDEGFLVRNLSPDGIAFLNGETFEEGLLGKGDIPHLGRLRFPLCA